MAIEVVARSVQVHFPESLFFHQSWVDLATYAKDEGHTFEWDKQGDALSVGTADPNGLIKVSASSLTGAILGGDVQDKLLMDFLEMLAPPSVSFVHSVVTTVGPLKGSLERAQKRSANGLFAGLGGTANGDATDWRLGVTHDSDLPEFEFVTTETRILNKKGIAAQLPDGGKLWSKRLPKLAVWTKYTFHNHGKHDGDPKTVVEAWNGSRDKALTLAEASFQKVSSAIQ